MPRGRVDPSPPLSPAGTAQAPHTAARTRHCGRVAARACAGGREGGSGVRRGAHAQTGPTGAFWGRCGGAPRAERSGRRRCLTSPCELRPAARWTGPGQPRRPGAQAPSRPRPPRLQDRGVWSKRGRGAGGGGGESRTEKAFVWGNRGGSPSDQRLCVFGRRPGRSAANRGSRRVPCRVSLCP